MVPPAIGPDHDFLSPTFKMYGSYGHILLDLLQHSSSFAHRYGSNVSFLGFGNRGGGFNQLAGIEGIVLMAGQVATLPTHGCMNTEKRDVGEVDV